MISAVVLFEITSSVQLLLILEDNFSFYKTSYLNEEDNFIEPSPSVRAPWSD
jgi:hypothetical protein